MDYSDIFTRPIEEMSDEEIISRARELRAKGKYPEIVKTPAEKKTKAKKVSKADAALDDLFALAASKAKEGE